MNIITPFSLFDNQFWFCIQKYDFEKKAKRLKNHNFEKIKIKL